MSTPRLLVLTGVLFCLTPGAPPAADKPSDGSTAKLFREQIRPVLESKCLLCHGGDKKRGGLDLRRRSAALAGGDNGPALKPGDPADSLLLQKLQKREMPPQNPLSTEQVAAFKKWIEAGAPYENEPLTLVVRRAGKDWWSLQPVRSVTPPTVSDPRTGAGAIDAFVLEKLRAKELWPTPEADR